MAAFKILVAAIVALAMTAAVHANQYRVSWIYDNAACNSPAVSGTFSSQPTCSAAACASQQETTCANDLSEVIPSDGSKGKFVVLETYSDSSCSENSFVMGQFSASDVCTGVAGIYTIQTCSGGKAISKVCSDSACSQCNPAGEADTDTCIAAGGGYTLIHCSSASSLAISAATVFAVGLAAVVSVAF